ncbi:MAG TPA: phenylalanine--tRNA ligase subunit beta [Candidatus Acidoferrum sp.]|nr:phenylalanine--tRNA ligase subunit beta [Candidatus Acidoferrum sp.]
MVTITVEQQDLEDLIGTKLPTNIDTLNEIFSQIKCEATRTLSEESGVEELSLENKDTNRPDLWSPEGIARSLRGFLGLKAGTGAYAVAGSSGVTIKVDARLEKIRPFIACSVIKNAQLSDAAIRGLMHLQDKLDESYGRGRRRSSIGLYEFNLITPPLRYAVTGPEEVSFVPLGTDERMSLNEITVRHPKGIEYGHIVKPNPLWPILLDSKDNVLSFPPIINSNDLGRITPRTHNVLVEVTGTSFDVVLNALTMVTISLADRGGRIYSSIVHYPYGKTKRSVTPVLKTRHMTIALDYVESVLGIALTAGQAVKLLREARFGASRMSKAVLDVTVPCFRLDIMHPVDVIEDIGIAYGLNQIKPRWPPHPTIGGITPQHEFNDLLREIMLGLGFQEVLTFALSNPDKLFTRMGLSPENVVDLQNPRVQTLTCLRNWLIPSLMEILSANIHVTYPQKIFEAGECVTRSSFTVEEVTRLAGVTCHAEASFTEVRASIDAVLSNLGQVVRMTELKHGSFVEGRAATVWIGEKQVGIVGEFHPQVLENWGIQNPAAALELDVQALRSAATNH